MKIWKQHCSVFLPSVVGTYLNTIITINCLPTNSSFLTLVMELTMSVMVASWYFTWRHNNTASDSGLALKHLCSLEVL